LGRGRQAIDEPKEESFIGLCRQRASAPPPTKMRRRCSSIVPDKLYPMSTLREAAADEHEEVSVTSAEPARHWNLATGH
jgi:hypothetical protein